MLCLISTLASGCYLIDLSPTPEHVAASAYYEQVATGIDYQAEPVERTAHLHSRDPRPLRDIEAGELRSMTLTEAILLAMDNNPLIRLDGEFLSPRNTLLNDPSRSPSVLDTVIQDTGVLFGQRGTAGALAEFDPRFTGNLIWRRNENIQNNAFLSGGLRPGDTLKEEAADFDARLEKVFATGSTLALNFGTDYSLNNVPARLFGSVYTGVASLELRQPLLAGAGTEFTQIAGPVGRLDQSLSGVNQGIVIARINVDISLAQIEADVRNLVFETQQLYWDLHLAFRQYEVQKATTLNLKGIWEKVRARFKGGLEQGGAADEAQAADNYYQSLAEKEQALATLMETEGRLRRLIGLPPNDGQVLRPSTPPVNARRTMNWSVAVTEAMSHRLELRKQKLAIRSLELQLKAARNIARPRLDFVAGYSVNAFGDRLNASNDNDGVTREGLRSAFGTLLQGDQTGWELGFQMTVPLGFRAEQSRIHNLEYRLVKARAGLAEQELEVSHELRNAAVGLERWYANLRIGERRVQAAQRRLKASQAEYDAGRISLDLLLRARVSVAQAETSYHRALAEYNKAIANIYYRSGTLLRGQGIHLDGQLPVVSTGNTFSSHSLN